MPYITQDRRAILEEGLKRLELNMNDFKKTIGLNKGDLNYMCYVLGKAFIGLKGESYQNISDAVDGIRGAGEELKRRVQDPYEDKCIGKNGDI